MASEYVSLTDEFKAIPGFDGYYARRDGSLWSAWQKGPIPGMKAGSISRTGKKLRKLRGKRHASGHMEAKLRSRKFVKWHHMVLLAFVGPRPAGMECRHLNGIPDDNRIENLAWGTRKENIADTIRHGRFSTRRKRDEATLLAVRIMFEAGEPIIRIAKKFKMHPKTVKRVAKNAN